MLFPKLRKYGYNLLHQESRVSRQDTKNTDSERWSELTESESQSPYNFERSKSRASENDDQDLGSREDILQWHLNNETASRWVLHRIRQENPELFNEVRDATMDEARTVTGQATYTFTPGEMGITCDELGFVEAISLASPARAYHISEGDQILKIGIEEYSENAVIEAEKSGSNYKVTFKVNGSVQEHDAGPFCQSHSSKVPITPMQEPSAIGDGLDTCIVQFSRKSFYCGTQEQDTVRVCVLRSGYLGGTTEAQYETIDGSAMSGIHYESSHGHISFQPHENIKIIEVGLIQKAYWVRPMDFHIRLKKLKGGAYGPISTTEVKVLSKEGFPTSRSNDLVREGRFNDYAMKCLRDYLWMNWQDPKVRRGTIKRMLVDQLHNLRMLLGLMVNKHLVDTVLNKNTPEDKRWLAANRVDDLILISLIMALAFAVVHVAEYQSLFWPVGGPSRLTLKLGLVRTILNFTSSARHAATDGELQMALTADSTDLVAGGYMSVLGLAQQVGMLLMLLAYLVLRPILMGELFPVSAIVAAGASPVLITITYWLRVEKRRKTISGMQTVSNELVLLAGRTVDSYTLIGDYDARKQWQREYENLVLSYNSARKQFNVTALHDLYLTIWLSTVVMLCWYIPVGGFRVLDENDPLTLGAFLANARTIKKLGHGWKCIFATIMEMQTVIPPLERLVRLMNSETIFKNQAALSSSASVTDLAYGFNSKLIVHHDMREPHLRPIILQNAHVKFNITRFDHIWKGQIQIQQGHLVALVGPHQQGKSTLLKAIGGRFGPDSTGTIFVPGHLQVHFVGGEILYFRKSLLHNLTFQLEADDPRADPQSIRDICSTLGISAAVLRYLEEPHLDEVHRWEEVISRSQSKLLSLARAIASDPDVLCVDKPFDTLEGQFRTLVARALKDIVRRGGFNHRREPSIKRSSSVQCFLSQKSDLRTCIVTLKTADLEKYHAIFNEIHDISKHGLRDRSSDDSLLAEHSEKEKNAATAKLLAL